ncbi:MAG: IS200/IS605 family transposase [Fimbriimonadaceae bacterium]|nr:IS200/IS605 family transposase [Fimbriimonadaceae bacterium]
MPQSLARLHIHLVFSTKYREPLISDGIRDALHAYLAAVLCDLRCAPVRINSVADHTHLLFDLARTLALCDVVERVKTSSSKWMKTKGSECAGFAWQAGYGAFAVSETGVAAVRAYIANQQHHHLTVSFQDEYRQLLGQHRMEYDEQYVWD